MAFEVKVGMKLQDVKAYVEKQDYMSKEQKTKIINFINDDTDGIVTHSTEKILLSSLLHGKSGAVFKGFNVNEKNAKNFSKDTYEYHDNFVAQDPYYTRTESVTARGKGNNYVSFNIHYKKGEEDFRSLDYNINNSSDTFYLDKDGNINTRYTHTGKAAYMDNDGDGIYDEKCVLVEGGGVWYNRDEKGNWQMKM